MKILIKRFVQYICLAALYPLVLLSLRKWNGIGAFFYYFFATALALVPGKIGGYFRVAYYKGVCDWVSWDVNIGFGTFFTKRGVRIGANVSIGAYCLIGEVDIADGCQIASRVSIPSGKHQHIVLEKKVHNDQPVFSRITIGSKTWIGESAVILDDIGSECIIGAGSVVTHPVADHHIIAGNPARPIKKTND